MTSAQRDATLEMCAAILRCSCCSPDLRFRARSLQACVALDAELSRLFGRASARR